MFDFFDFFQYCILNLQAEFSHRPTEPGLSFLIIHIKSGRDDIQILGTVGKRPQLLHLPEERIQFVIRSRSLLLHLLLLLLLCCRCYCDRHMSNSGRLRCRRPPATAPCRRLLSPDDSGREAQDGLVDICSFRG
jgi:hypothetical protein